MKFFSLLLTTSAALLIAGCDNARNEFNKAYDQAFTENWKSSFVKSCSNGDVQRATICTCLAEKSVEKLKVEQLSDIEVIKKEIFPLCRG